MKDSLLPKVFNVGIGNEVLGSLEMVVCVRVELSVPEALDSVVTGEASDVVVHDFGGVFDIVGAVGKRAGVDVDGAGTVTTE